MATIHIFGRLTGDPETRLMPNNGGTVTSFSLADNHGKDANNQDKVDFFRCSAFGKQADLIFNSCKKGHRLNVSGRFESRVFTNNQGQQQTSLDVSVNAFDFVEPKSDAGPTQQAPAAQPPAPGPYPPQAQPPRPAAPPVQQAPQPQQPAQPQTQQPQYYQDPNTKAWYQAVNGQWVPLQQQAPAAPAQQPPMGCPPGDLPF